MINRPEDISKIDPLKSVSGQGESSTRTGQGFDAYMEKAGMQMPHTNPQAISPFDLAQGQRSVLATGPNFDTLLNQVNSSYAMLGDVVTGLKTKNLKLKQSDRTVLRKKLKEAYGHLSQVSSKMGLQPAEVKETSSGGLLGKLINFGIACQENIDSVKKHFMTLKQKGTKLDPTDFLNIQLKLNHAQQEIEFASLILSKGVDAIKNLMSTTL
jgi:hypothetical protein